MCLIADLDRLYSDMLAARVDDDTRWAALTLLIKATIPDIDDDGIRDVVSWWQDLVRGKLSLLDGELAKIGRQVPGARTARALTDQSARLGRRAEENNLLDAGPRTIRFVTNDWDLVVLAGSRHRRANRHHDRHGCGNDLRPHRHFASAPQRAA